MQTIVRRETAGDERVIHKLLATAFPTDQEALLVDRLRENGRLSISLVAEVEDTIVGHIAFSPVTIKHANTELIGAGLAPVAVLPQWQRRGVGAQLVRAGLSASTKAGTRFIIVLGEPDYYRRFGFKNASLWRVTNIYGVDEPFMALELRPDSIHPGLALYAPEFAGLS
jgi:putative acetyltransferase